MSGSLADFRRLFFGTSDEELAALSDAAANGVTLSDVTGNISAASATKSGWYSVPSGNSGTAIPPEGQVSLIPIFIDRTVTVDRIAAAVTAVGTAGAVIRLGIYSSGRDGMPSTLLLDAGTISGESATVQEININQVLTPGKYWLAAVVQGGASTRPTVRTSTTANQPGLAAAAANTALGVVSLGLFASNIAGALPANIAISDTKDAPVRVTLRFV